MMNDDDSFWPSRPAAPRAYTTIGREEKQTVSTSRPDEEPSPRADGPWLDLRESREVQGMKEVQSRTFSNIQEAKKLLTAFNTISAQSLEQANVELQKSAAIVRVLTADLNIIFQKTRALRMRLQKRLPNSPELAQTCPYEEED